MQKIENPDYKALYEQGLVENKELKAQMRRIVLPDAEAELTDEEFEQARRKREIEIANEKMLRRVLAEKANRNQMIS